MKLKKKNNITIFFYIFIFILFSIFFIFILYRILFPFISSNFFIESFNSLTNSIKSTEKFSNYIMNDDTIDDGLLSINVSDKYNPSYSSSSIYSKLKKSSKSKKENDKNDPMKFDSNYSKNSFCQLDSSKKKCVCKFQKDDIKVAFNSPQINCNKICSSLEPSECLENKEFSEIPYYCNINGKCEKYEGTIISSHISANNCGTEPLTNQLLLPYATLEECKKTIEPCDAYNDPSKSVNYNKTKCLKNSNCGYCTNSTGQGKCISGNPSGPNDLNKYYYCNPYNGSTNNVYEYGPELEFISIN